MHWRSAGHRMHFIGSSVPTEPSACVAASSRLARGALFISSLLPVPAVAIDCYDRGMVSQLIDAPGRVEPDAQELSHGGSAHGKRELAATHAIRSVGMLAGREIWTIVSGYASFA